MIDPAGRKIDYLRISVTDRCNERCLYCMPESFKDWIPSAKTLNEEEILAILKTSTELGFRKFRVTGGEPLIRSGIVSLIGKMIATPGVEVLQLTTNGTRLPELAESLYHTGLRRMNVSLDAIDPDIYHHITKGHVEPVIEGIRLAKRLGFESIKINTVLMRGKNESQILPLLDFAAELDVAVRFIELMPVSMTEMLDESHFLPVAEVQRKIEQDDFLESDPICRGFGPAKYYRLLKRKVVVGFISPLTNLHFCESCNKMRLTCDGFLRPCLGNHQETSLMPALRPVFDQTQLKELFLETLQNKPLEHIFRENYHPHRIMTAIGG